MEIAGAKQAALEQVLDHSETKFDIDLPLPQDDEKDFVKGYVETYAKTSVEANPPVSDWAQHTSFAEPQSNVFMAMYPTNDDSTAPLAPNARSSSDMPPTSSDAQAIETTCTGVAFFNPLVPSFVPSLTKPAPVQSSWIYNNVLPATSHSVMPPLTSSEGIHSTIQSSVSSSSTCAIPSGSVSSSPSKTEQGLIELAKTLADQVNLNRLPSPEPSIFSGEPLISYPGWKSAFQILIEQRQIPPSERIQYLKRYVSGPVRDAIEGYFLLPSDRAYEEAKKTLDKRYGDPFVISNAFRDKLEKWPEILPRDGTGLRKFPDFLQQCQIAMHTISSLSVLDDDRENRKLLTKLPDWMVSRWGRIVARWKEEKSLFPPFKEFIEFVTKEATIACDPVTSLQSLKEVSDGQKSSKMPNRQEKGYRGSRTFLAEVTEKDKKPPEQTPKISCTFCNRPHELDDCRAFLNKSLAERKTFIKEKRLCFASLQGGHISKRCKHRKKCKTCSKFHPTSLHGDQKNMSKQGERSDNLEKSKGETAVKVTLPEGHTGAVSLINVDKCRKCSMIVPVYLSHCDSPERKRDLCMHSWTHSQTQHLFLENTCKALGVSGTEVKLSLSTMYAANKI